MLVDSVFCDGGLLGSNPTPLGGTYAWCHVYRDGLVNKGSGLLYPRDVGLPLVSNNHTELAAMIFALSVLPDGWAGPVYTDSFVTLCRAKNPHKGKFKGVPAGMRERIKQERHRLGMLDFVLLAGHPKGDDLIRGFKVKGKVPVSRWNKLCDDLCNEERFNFEAGRQALEVARSLLDG